MCPPAHIRLDVWPDIPTSDETFRSSNSGVGEGVEAVEHEYSRDHRSWKTPVERSQTSLAVEAGMRTLLSLRDMEDERLESSSCALAIPSKSMSWR